jgi:hypothetical protein
MTHEEGNKIICEFMGQDYETMLDSIWGEYYNSGIRNPEFMKNPENYNFYHSSWDWLFLVIEKIEDLDPNNRVSHTYSIDITRNGTTAYKNIWGHGESRIISHNNSHNNRLNNTWLTCIEFILWYQKETLIKEHQSTQNR